MDKETLGKTSGYEYQIMFEMITEDVVTTNLIKLDRLYKGVNLYVKHNKVDSLRYKIFINDMNLYRGIVHKLKESDENLKTKIDKLAQDLLNNFNWEAVSNEDQVHIENGKRSYWFWWH